MEQLITSSQSESDEQRSEMMISTSFEFMLKYNVRLGSVRFG